MKYLISLFLILSLSSCNKDQNQQLPESQVIAVVGDESITVDLLNAFLLSNGISQKDEETVNSALNRLIDDIAMANYAKKKQAKLTKEQLYTLKYLKLKAYAYAAKQDYLSNNTISEEAIKKEYDNAQKQTQGIQFHVHHLLYEDEIQAIKQLENIKTADDFLIQEKVYLENNKNKKNIGDLGWVLMSQLPKSFAEVLPTLKEKSIHPKVVNSSFGAHIVYLEATRRMQPPPLEKVKAGIIKTLKAKQLSKFSQLARAKAHVVMKK